MPPVDNEQPVDGAENHQRSRLREQLSYMHRTGPTRRWARWWRHRINTMRQHRRARWDRPPEPHDWRWGIGLVGRGLVLAGLAMLGFVAYQLWGTGLQTAAAQRTLDERFSALIAETPAVSIATTPTTTAVVPTTTIATMTSTTTIVDNSTTTTTTVAPATWPADAGISIGDPVARIEMPALGTDHIVVAGVGVDELQQGPGHFPDTPLPGQLGNAAIAGHRTTYGQPFHDVDRLAEGDDIVITTPAGRFVYVVTGTRIVEPTDYYVVATEDPTTAVLTLTSCHPKWSAAQRIIVSATLDPTRSDTPTSPTGYATASHTTPATLPAAEISTTVATSDTTAASGSAVPTPTTVTPTTVAPATTALTTTAVVVPEQPLASDAAFSRGWFHDPDAIGSVAIWAAVLIVIAVAASRLNRRFRTLAAGTLPALVPFAFALYRFYAELNRLLPPNL